MNNDRDLTLEEMMGFFANIGMNVAVFDEEGISKVDPKEPTCKCCGKVPSDISEYIEFAKDEKISPSQYVKENEGTYNPITNKFYCTDCYIDLGCPSGKA